MYRFAILFSVAWCCFWGSAFAQEGQTVTSQIEAATVYREGALVTRAAQAELPAGRHELIFTGLTAELDPASIQLKATGDLTVLAVTHRLDYRDVPGSDTAIEQLQDSIQGALDRQRYWQARREIAQEELELLAANRQFSGQQTGLDAADLERGVAFYRERLSAVKLELLAIEDSLQHYQQLRGSLGRQLDERRGRTQRATSQVLVTVIAEASLRAEFGLSYLVRDAGWEPVYDIRVADIAEPIDLRYRAKVRQNSGEDWPDIRLTLSTGDPSRSATAPALQPWRLRPNQRPWWENPAIARIDLATGIVYGRITDEYGEPLIGANVLVEGTTAGAVTDYDGIYQIKVPPGARELVISYTGFETQRIPIAGSRADVVLESGMQLDEVVVTGQGRRARRNEVTAARPPERAVPVATERQPTTVQFAIELPYSIPADNKPRDVAIQRYAVPATYEYFAIPKLEPAAFLTAAVTDWEQYDLLSGDMQLFFEGTYLGTSFLDVSELTDTLQLSLGRDDNIVIERRVDENFRSSGFLSNRQRETRGWIIEVRNKKERPVQLTLLDQVPLTTASTIDIKYDLPDGVQHDEDTGQLKWVLTLAPRAAIEVGYGYEVRYPAGIRVYLE
jgi:hypothetical protein